MTEVSAVAEWRLDENVELSFDRTIERRKVHRSAVSEVFITDVRAVGDGRVALAAQLPTCHAYFNDHRSAAGVDPLLIMEICRQAGLAAAYELGVSVDVVLVPADWDLRVAVPGTWSSDEPAINLRIDTVFAWTRLRRGRPRAGVCEQRVFVGDQQIATLHAKNQFLSYEELEVLRTAQRGTPAPRTGDMVYRPDPELVEPHVVGRHNHLNVVLAGLARGADEVSARVALPLSNRALFDHSYDHVTMQVLTEAARQLIVSAVAASENAGHGWHLTRLTGQFTRFAELDSTVTVRAEIPAPEAAEREFLVFVEQDGDVVAELGVTMSRGLGPA